MFYFKHMDFLIPYTLTQIYTQNRSRGDQFDPHEHDAIWNAEAISKPLQGRNHELASPCTSITQWTAGKDALPVN